MSENANPLGIIQVPIDEEGHQTRAYIPLDVISEEEVERLRTEHLELNDGEQSGESAPGVKDDAEERVKEVIGSALANPVGEGDEAPVSPEEGLG